ncbi:MAG: alpha/beta hydrolase [Methylomonas sp.]|jgi:pimeloyl-ACP methyl ester carboxylesterase
MRYSPGQNWLLIRGLSREAAHWGGFLSTLQTVFPAADIHTLDLCGAGEYYPLTCPGNITEITEIARQNALDKGFLSKPLTLVALSLGGMVAWEWLQKYPLDLEGAALINTSVAGLSPFHQRLRWQSYQALAGILLKKNLYERELAIIRLVSNCREHDETTVENWLQIQIKRPVSPSNSLRQIMAAASYKPASVKPLQPVLLINSQGDRLVAPTCSKAIQSKWRLELRTHPWAGHDISLDDGVWLANRLKEWAELHGKQII